MEDKLITLAIHSYEKAQILQTLLEAEGITVFIHNVNQIQPIVAAGVRVKIKESDLPHALRILESNQWNEKFETFLDKRNDIILVPVDFSNYTFKSCELAIRHAAKAGYEVTLMHAYYITNFPSAITLGETLSYQRQEEVPIVLIKQVEKKMDKLIKELHSKMQQGVLPAVKINRLLREGIPEEEIESVVRKICPQMIIMGTRGLKQKEADLIGSVTAEVIDTTHVPVLAIPEDVPFDSLDEVQNIALATSYSQSDLVFFDMFMELIKDYPVHIHLFNISTTHDDWNEIKLAGVQDYLEKQYPKNSFTHYVLSDGKLLDSIDHFVRENNIDIIAMSKKKKRLIARLFNISLARKMLFYSNTPLLIMNT